MLEIIENDLKERVEGRGGTRALADALALKAPVLLDFVHCMWCKEQTFPFFFPPRAMMLS